MFEDEVAPPPRQPLSRWIRKLAWLVVTVAVLGEVGHQVLGRWGQALAHHFFHIAFAGGAAVIFVWFVAADVRRHGRPEFTWRLRPRTGEPKAT
jgi:hypothetical protein